jgi:ABC-type lipoprotein export system ATPase subunit
MMTSDIDNIYVSQEQPTLGVNYESDKVEAGEFLSIVGNIEDIKLMLMHIFGLLDKPEKNNASTCGDEDIKMRRKSLNRYKKNTIGYAKKPSKLLTHLTVLENVMFPMAYYKTKYNLKERAMDLLKLVGLEDKLNNYSYELNIEDQLRLSIAQALINFPKYLIVDELVEKADFKIRENITKLLREINNGGQTIIFITNNIEVVPEGSDVMTLNKFNYKNNNKVSFKF